MHGISDFLFARGSFLEGVGRALDIGGTMADFNSSLTPAQADYLALRMDWQVVGDDLRRAMGQVGQELAEPPENGREG